MGKKVLSIIIWAAIAILGAASFALLALANGETISASWLLIAAVCTYAVAYRFYSKFIAYKIFKLDDNRATPIVILITIESFRIWYNYLVNKNQMILYETPYIKSKYAPIKK